MKDAHLRLGMLEYERNTEKISTRIRVRVSHYIGEGADAHLLSVFGNDSDVGAITAAVHDQNRFRLTFPDGQVQEISLGERATCYRGGVTIPGRKHGIRHMVTLSEEIRGLGSVNRTYSLSNSPDVVWSTIVQRLGLPAAPESAERMMELFEKKKRITLPDCIGYVQAGSGPHRGGVVNPDTGVLIRTSEGESYTRLDFDKLKVAETVERPNGGSKNFSAVWQADSKKIQRMAPVEYIGRYMRGWFDFAIADELHQLAGDTAQGNGLGVLERAALKLIGLTGTLMGGYADDLFNIFYRMEADRIVREGFAHGGEGRREFQEQFGVLETIERITESDNACTRASKKTVQILKKPGASPLLFGRFLMSSTAFVSLEDIADNLPPYDESVLPSEMDEALATAYRELERDLRDAMQENRGNKSLMSTLLNALLLYPDHPYGFDEIWARRFDPVAKRYERFFVTAPAELSQKHTYAKEADLIRDIQEELRLGRRCQVYATFTGEKDVNGRLEALLRQTGMRVAVLRASVPTHKREEWYERQLESGVEVVICHPKLVETGLDLLAFPTLYFYQTGYSLHTLRQASRRSWRIGQKLPVRVKFLTYKGTMQETCLQLMGRKMLVALMMEGKFSGEGLQSLDADEDLMSAMARELVERAGVGQSADAIWADLRRERAMHVPSMLVGSQMEPGEEGDPSWPLLSQEPVAASLPVPQVVEPAPKRQQKPSPLWPTGHTEGAQMLLFA